MPRRAQPLSAAKVKVAGPGTYNDGNGLRLVVKGTGARAWVFRYTRHGRTREMGLGRAGSEPGAVSLAEARTRAGALHRAVRDGGDPLDDRIAAKVAAEAERQRAKLRAVTFGDVASQYLRAHERSWRNPAHRAQWRSTLDAYVLPVFGSMPVAEVDTGHVRAALEPIWHEKPETAGRVRGRIEVILDYARAAGWRSGENPARWRGHLDNLLPRRSKVRAVEHHAALDWRQASAFMSALAEQAGTAALALAFTVLTAARTGEVIGATWGEIDFGARAWTIPAARMKAGREHRVPLTTDALELLRRAATGGLKDDSTAPIFPGAKAGKGLSNMAMTTVLRRMKRGDVTVHGMRSAFRDWAAETTRYPGDVVEAALAHVVSSKTEAAYRRGDLFEKRRALMDAWSRFCAEPYVTPLGPVVLLRA